jgi:STAS domain
MRLTVDCAGWTEPELGTIGALARLELNARRSGCRLELENAGPLVVELLELAGLRDVLLLKRERQAEQRK